MQALRRILALVQKEFIAIAKDPKSRFVVIGPPIIQFFVFGYAATFDVTAVRYAVLDEDRTTISRELLAEFDGSDNFRLVATLNHDNEIAPIINDQAARMVLHIPRHFGGDIAAGRPTNVQIIVDGRNSNVASIALGYANLIVADFNNRKTGRGPSSTPTRPAVQMIDRAWYNPNLVSRWFITSALGGVICTVVVTILSSLSVAREREFGTFDQLLVAPFSPTEILIGKSIPPFVFGLTNALLLSAAAVLWFGVPFEGSLPALLVILSVYILAVVGVGLFVSSLSMTMQQGLLGSFIAIMPIIILSGFTTPIENMPHWLQRLTLANPLRYVVVAMRGIFLEGATLADIHRHVWPLSVIALSTLAAAGWLFRHRTA
ncbi:MAG: ABC transporter permease [Phycisphaerales bacterium]|nr:ABC transporter permease [Phycisphaerales bacterium]MCB9854381.1 ABC transporter permease [Phycisphaerales bacterium]MCB9863582.1 ABC transporter permease [Phycisphaerales bacterium]